MPFESWVDVLGPLSTSYGPRDATRTKLSGSVTLAWPTRTSSSTSSPVIGVCSASGPLGQTMPFHFPSSISDLGLNDEIAATSASRYAA